MANRGVLRGHSQSSGLLLLSLLCRSCPPGWNNEIYPVYTPRQERPYSGKGVALGIEHAALPLFGSINFGCLLTGKLPLVFENQQFPHLNLTRRSMIALQRERRCFGSPVAPFQRARTSVRSRDLSAVNSVSSGYKWPGRYDCPVGVEWDSMRVPKTPLFANVLRSPL